MDFCGAAASRIKNLMYYTRCTHIFARLSSAFFVSRPLRKTLGLSGFFLRSAFAHKVPQDQFEIYGRTLNRLFSPRKIPLHILCGPCTGYHLQMYSMIRICSMCRQRRAFFAAFRSALGRSFFHITNSHLIFRNVSQIAFMPE